MYLVRYFTVVTSSWPSPIKKVYKPIHFWKLELKPNSTSTKLGSQSKRFSRYSHLKKSCTEPYTFLQWTINNFFKFFISSTKWTTNLVFARKCLRMNYEFTDITFVFISFKKMEIFNLFLHRTSSCSGIKL